MGNKNVPHVELYCPNCPYVMEFMEDFDQYVCRVCGHKQPGHLDYPKHHWPKGKKFKTSEGWLRCPKCGTRRKEDFRENAKHRYRYQSPFGEDLTVLPNCKHGLWGV